MIDITSAMSITPTIEQPTKWLPTHPATSWYRERSSRDPKKSYGIAQLWRILQTKKELALIDSRKQTEHASDLGTHVLHTIHEKNSVALISVSLVVNEVGKTIHCTIQQVGGAVGYRIAGLGVTIKLK